MDYRRILALCVILSILGAGEALFKPLPCNDELRSGPVRWRKFSELFGKVSKGDHIEIPCGTAVTLDVKNLPPLSGLSINGYFRVPFGDGKFRIQSNWVLVQGRFFAGHKEKQFLRGSGLSITLTHSDKDFVFNRKGKNLNFGPKAFVALGGQVFFNGVPGGRECVVSTWVKIAETARKHSKNIVVDGDVTGCWEPGHEIVVSSTSTNFREREVRKILNLKRIGTDKTKIVLNRPFQHSHTGLNSRFKVGDKWISEAGEVGLLTRNIAISGRLNPKDRLEGGHMVIHETALHQRLHGIEFSSMGQQGVLGRYPCHFHMCGRVRGSTFVGNSVHDTLQRGLTIHGSDNVRVAYNVFNNILGHGILLEDHSETDNIIRNNAGFHNEKPTRLIMINKKPETDDFPAMFWITNPKNTFEDNVSSGSRFSGFWFELGETIRGLSMAKFAHKRKMNPRKLPLGTFERNEAHSNMNHGFRTYPDGYTPTEKVYFREILAWKNRYGVFLHNSRSISVVDSVIADNLELGLDFNEVLDCTLKNSVVVGKSGLGEVCPMYGAVRNSGMTYADGASGNRMENVKLDRYGSCTEPVISQMIDNKDMYGMLSASTGLVDVQALDRKDIINLDKGFSSPDSKWKLAAIRIAGGNTMGGSSGFLVTNLPIMQSPPGEAKCSRVSQNTRFCPGSCYRTVRVSYPCSTGKSYSIRVMRLADRATETLTYVTKTKPMADFFLNLRAGHEYSIELLMSYGESHPRNFYLSYADGSMACNGEVTVLFPNQNFAWSDYYKNQPIYEKPCPGSLITVPEHSVTYVDKCVSGKLHRAFHLPSDYIDKESPLFLSIDASKPVPAADICDSPVSRCVAVRPYSTWKYSERGSESRAFAKTTFDDRSWSEGKAVFGQGYNTVETVLKGNHRTYYFRRSFNLNGNVSCYKASTAGLRIMYGDGLVVYINGYEIYRKNMPKGPPSSNVYATKPGTHWRHEMHKISKSLTMLQDGRNVIAVELHRYEKDNWGRHTTIFDLQLDLPILHGCLPGF